MSYCFPLFLELNNIKSLNVILCPTKPSPYLEPKDIKSFIYLKNHEFHEIINKLGFHSLKYCFR